MESAQAAQDIKIRFDSFQQQFQEVRTLRQICRQKKYLWKIEEIKFHIFTKNSQAQESLSEQLRASEEEAFKSRRVQVKCYLFKFSFVRFCRITRKSVIRDL